MAKKGINVFVGINDTAFQKGIKRINKSLGRLGSRMQSAGRNMTRNITMPLGLAGVASVKMAMDFQTSLTKIQTLVGATAEQVKGYESAIRSISSTTATGQKELADGLFFITSAGFEGQQALDALEVSAKGAAMGMGEMQDIASAVTSIMTGYADSNMTAGQAGDLLHETLKQGKFEASEFMSSVGQVIPTAVAAGVSFEELGAATATLSKLSGDARGSLTAVNSVMMKMLTPGSEQKEILDSIGMSYDDLQGMMSESLMGTLQHLFTELEGNNEMLVKVFGSSRAVKAAFGTMGAQAETYQKVLDGMNDSQGNVNDGFETVSQTAGFQAKQAFEDLKNAAMELGAMLLPIVTKIVGFVSKLVKGFTDLSSSTKKTVLALAGVAMAIGPALSLIGGLFTAIATVGLPVIAAIGTLVGIGYYIYKNWGQVKKVLVDVINYFIDLYNESIIFRAAIQLIILVFKNLWAAAKFSFNNMIDIVNGMITGWIGQFKAVGKVIASALKFDWKGVKEGAGDYFDSVKGGFEQIGKDIADNATEFGEEIAENTSTAIENTLSREKIEFVTEDDIDNGIAAVGSMATGMLDKMKSVFGSGGFVLPEVSFDGNKSPEENETINLNPPDPSKWQTFFEKLKQGWENFKENGIQNIQQVLGVFSNIMNQMEAISNQRFQNEMAILEEKQIKEQESLEASKEREIQRINDSVLSDEDKEKRLLAIDEKYEGLKSNLDKRQADEKKKIQIRKAKADKKYNIMNALINTAMAITNALANIPAPFNIAVAATMGILGASQVAAIKATPIPALAEGGLAFGPTAALVGDNPGASADPEVIAPLSKLQDMIGGNTVHVVGEISGENIVLASDRYKNNKSRFF